MIVQSTLMLSVELKRCALRATRAAAVICICLALAACGQSRERAPTAEFIDDTGVYNSSFRALAMVSLRHFVDETGMSAYLRALPDAESYTELVEQAQAQLDAHTSEPAFHIFFSRDPGIVFVLVSGQDPRYSWALTDLGIRGGDWYRALQVRSIDDPLRGVIGVLSELRTRSTSFAPPGESRPWSAEGAAWLLRDSVTQELWFASPAILEHRVSPNPLNAPIYWAFAALEIPLQDHPFLLSVSLSIVATSYLLLLLTPAWFLRQLPPRRFGTSDVMAWSLPKLAGLFLLRTTPWLWAGLVYVAVLPSILQVIGAIDYYGLEQTLVIREMAGQSSLGQTLVAASIHERLEPSWLTTVLVVAFASFAVLRLTLNEHIRYNSLYDLDEEGVQAFWRSMASEYGARTLPSPFIALFRHALFVPVWWLAPANLAKARALRALWEHASSLVFLIIAILLGTFYLGPALSTLMLVSATLLAASMFFLDLGAALRFERQAHFVRWVKTW